MDMISLHFVVTIHLFFMPFTCNRILRSHPLSQFKRRLKTHLFGLWDHSTLWHWLLVNWRY